MINELTESQKKRYEIIKRNCEEIMKLERDKFNYRADLERLRRDIATGIKSNAKLDPNEEQQGWSANIGNAKKGEAFTEAELEKLKDQQKQLLKKIEGIVGL